MLGNSDAYNTTREDLIKVFGEKIATRFIEFRNKFNPIKKIIELKNKGIIPIPFDHKFYPDQLKNISDPPICLYVKGDIGKYDFPKKYFFGVVGTRKPTPYGKQIAKKFASELSEAGFIIVSGMAMGIDSVAHWAAINSYGRTIAFLGCGVDVIYPFSNYRLYHEIIKKTD